jgi:CspA family cold shock protein
MTFGTGAPVKQSAAGNVVAPSWGKLSVTDVGASGAEMPSGIIKFFDGNRGFGFITTDDKSADIFFMRPPSRRVHKAKPYQGDRVIYDVGSDIKSGRERAANVRVTDDNAKSRRR